MTSELAVSLAVAGWLTLIGSASAALTVSTANQSPGGTFTPTWTVATNNLIFGRSPSSSSGSFTLESAGGSAKLTDGAIGPVGSGTSPFATAGNNGSAGHEVVYTLPANDYGYDVTNITVYSGWGDNGRDAQGFYVLYASKANPTTFLPLGYVSYNPTVAANTPTANRVIFTDSDGAAIATNVAALKFDFSVPGVENSYAGYSEITVQGTPSTGVKTPPIVMTMANQSGIAAGASPTWSIETDSLIRGMAPSSVGTGNFAYETGVAGTPALTDGSFGAANATSTYATCGGNGQGGSSVTYTLTNSVLGSDITNIVVYSGWGNPARDGQYYNISYSTVSTPTTYIPLTSVYYNPYSASGVSACRVAIRTSTGVPLAINVYSLKFDFSPQTGGLDNGYSGYAEIIVEGKDAGAPYLLADTQPATAATVVGDQVVFTAAFSNTPAATFQWQKIAGGVTNDISGATTTTLALNNVQLSDAGSYRLKAVNAANSALVSYTSASALTVSSLPAPVNNIINAFAAQTGHGNGTVFTPTWPVTTNNSLIAGQAPTSVGAGNFSLEVVGRSVNSLTAGDNGALSVITGTSGTTCSTNYVTCGVSPAGQSFTYRLLGSATGFDLTNIVVYGGWADHGRDEQKYTVYYSTIAAPTTFNALETVDYNPSDPANAQSATRVSILPAGAALAKNVYAVMFDFNLVGAPAKNGFEGYSQIAIYGQPSAPAPVLAQDITPLTASDVVGSQVILTAAFSSATPVTYQWFKDGALLSGATNTILTLSNLQLTDMATNSGYSLVASNASGTTATRACALTVRPVPAAVGNLVTAFATQTSDAGTFSPTWDTNAFAASLIARATPTTYGTGNFNDPDVNASSHNLAGGLPVLTDGNYGTLVTGGAHPAFATCGSTAGQFVTYPLPASTYGYDLTNIMIASGWNDGGRDADWATILYSTVANPTTFVPLAVVTNDSTVSVNSVIRGTVTPVTGVLASNVYAVKFDFTTPAGIPNGYSGISQVNVFGSPSVNPPTGPVVTVATQNTNAPDWVIAPNSLIANQLPSSSQGDFLAAYNHENCGGLPVLTDGTFGPAGFGNTNFAAAGYNPVLAGTSLTYTSPSGWNLSNIVVYSGWGNYDRDGQYYTIYYTTVANPNIQIPLVTVNYNPLVLTGPSADRVAIAAPNGGLLATNVHSVTFDFTVQGGNDYGYSGYAEIGLYGVANHAPVASDFALGVASGGTVTVAVVGGKHAPTDADGDSVTVTALAGAVNGAISTDGRSVTYTSTNGASSDSFAYTVSDGRGGFDTRTVAVSLFAATGFNQLNAQAQGADMVLTYAGIPGFRYALDRTYNLAPPIQWEAQATNLAATNGCLIFTNTPPVGTNSYFRTRYVP